MLARFISPIDSRGGDLEENGALRGLKKERKLEQSVLEKIWDFPNKFEVREATQSILLMYAAEAVRPAQPGAPSAAATPKWPKGLRNIVPETSEAREFSNFIEVS